MSNWRYKIELNGVIERVSEDFDLTRVEEPCPEEVRDALAAECEKAQPLYRFGQQFRDAKSIAEVNRILDSVFTVADEKLVWCGL
jgi:hypothetical protein